MLVATRLNIKPQILWSVVFNHLDVSLLRWVSDAWYYQSAHFISQNINKSSHYTIIRLCRFLYNHMLEHVDGWSGWILLYVANCTIMAISRQKKNPKPGLCPTLIEWLHGFFIVQTTIDSTAHPNPLYSSKHCVCTTSRTHIRPAQDSNSVPLSFEQQLDRMSLRVNKNYLNDVMLGWLISSQQ